MFKLFRPAVALLTFIAVSSFITDRPSQAVQTRTSEARPYFTEPALSPDRG